MKKVLLVVASLLVVSSIMAAMAYTSASLPIESQATITATDQALLAVTGNSKHAAVDYVQQDVNNGQNSSDIESLLFNFDKGHDDGEFGMQPGSTYEWDKLFKVQNNADHSITGVIKFAPSEDGPTLDLHPGTVKVRENGTADWEEIEDGQSLEFTLDPDDNAKFDVMFTFPEINFGDEMGDEAGEGFGIDDLHKYFDIVVEAVSDVSGEDWAVDANVNN
ncbi:hypothetical protein [Chengkuizengella sediminis]|uniref:hypothetical protein n=1 Tax=Chengkuizengella sediminis TaxID=1885917 RepID=UPI0013898D49|nr:hypothetical protein [Chengkuizengella sediminis]NDI35920.1 hypothetical protein [Chengkuizengella sediminis]